jgi:exodeoxyribonuclease VII large subunit
LLAETRHAEAVTVGEYAAALGRALRSVGSAVIEGEVQKVSRTQRGMIYFELTDGEALLSCKAFARDAARFERQPQTGDLVRVQVDRPDFYLARGSVSLIVSAVSLAGEGELLRRRAELLTRLNAEGLCDPERRRGLPRFPRAVGVIAGQGSDGMSDVVRALSDRWPAVRIVTCASLVQGKAAPSQLIDALARLQDHEAVDVIVMARGGGSVQDLACFDDEGLCRAVFACAVPVVCAIGHTDNNPVCNHVAWNAYTPSRSAELVVPSGIEIRRDLVGAGDELDRVPAQLALSGERVQACARHLTGGSMIEGHLERVRAGAAELGSAIDAGLTLRQHGAVQAASAIAAAPHRAARALAAERETLAGAGMALARTSDRLQNVGQQVREVAARLGESTQRQLTDHTRSYLRAGARLTAESRTGLDRRDARGREAVTREARSVLDGVRRRLDDARRDAAHQAEIIAAGDFRRRGWLLASSADGAPARSAAHLSPGQALRLHLHDGHADVHVEHTHHDRGSDNP